MPEPRLRSRTLRRVKRKLPSGSTVTHYEKRNPPLAKCGNCGIELKGLIRARPTKMKTLGISKKRVDRPFGGHLCSGCSRKLIKNEARE